MNQKTEESKTAYNQPNNRKMDDKRAIEILKNAEYGILSTSSKRNIPYGVAVNYFYVPEENSIYFHSKRVGNKIENIKNNPNISLFILGNQEVIPDRYITHYESIIVTGKASLILDEEQIKEKLIRLCEKFAPKELQRREEVINKYLKAVCIVKISIENITGKKNQDY